MLVSYLVRGQLVIPNRFFCGIPVRYQAVHGSEVAGALDIKDEPIAFHDFRSGLVAIRGPNILLCQDRPITLDDWPDPIASHGLGKISPLGDKRVLQTKIE